MTKKSEPSFKLKMIIWDAAVTVSTKNMAAVCRRANEMLGVRWDKGELLGEVMPEVRKVHAIIEDIQRLSPEVVVAKLPQRVWSLRHDQEKIKQLAKESIESKKQGTEEVHDSHDRSISESDFLMQKRSQKYYETRDTQQ